MSPEVIEYLVQLLTTVGTESQLLLHTLFIMIYNDDTFVPWISDLLLNPNRGFVNDIVLAAVEVYMKEHGISLSP